MTPRENSVVKAIGKYLDSLGCWWIKTTGVSCVGCPDIICCYQGYFVAIEVKREHDGAYGVTRKQQHELSKIARAGGCSLVAASVDDVRLKLETL